ncbi:MAG: radical SAM/SPASM domain-containing protein [Pseudomonadota bacterium]
MSKGHSKKRFKKVYIEITNICNLNCNFCPGTCRPPEIMDEKRFGQILTAIRPYTDYIFFHLMGEPLLNPNLGRFLEMSHESGLKTNLTTNGTRLRQVQSVLLNAPALRQINISLNSFEANTLTKPLKTYLTEVIEFVNTAVENTGMFCSIRLWNFDTERLKGNNRFNRQILEFFESQFKLSPGHLSELSLDNPRATLKERIFLYLAEKFEWPDLERVQSNHQLFCHGLRDQMGILVDGTVVPCCLDNNANIPLGNVLDTPLTDILHSERALALFNGFSRRCAVELLCQKCSYALRY